LIDQILLMSGIILLLVAAVVILFAPAMIADGKGHSFWGFFLISLFAWPLAFIWAWPILDDKNKESER